MERRNFIKAIGALFIAPAVNKVTAQESPRTIEIDANEGGYFVPADIADLIRKELEDHDGIMIESKQEFYTALSDETRVLIWPDPK